MSDINIKQIIAHDINTELDSPTLFDRILNLTAIPTKILKFFKDHINVSLNAKQIKTCEFEEGAKVKNQSIRINESITDQETFVTVTKEMTQDLHRAIKSTSSNSSGTIFFIIYDLNQINYLGILKMDPSSGIQIDKTTLELSIQDNILPKPEDRLHKCAFIKLPPFAEGSEVDLYVLDRQRGPRGISKFFMNTFLQANELLNNRIMSERVISKLYDEAPNIAPGKEDIEFHLEVDKTFRNGRQIDLDHALEELIQPYMENEKQREEYIESFKQSFREEYDKYHFNFQVEKEATTVVFTSDEKDIKLEFPINILGDVVRINDPNKVPFKLEIHKHLNQKYK